jgi:hypothetical protein
VPIDQVVTAALQRFTVRDLSVENPPLEDVIKAIYRGDIADPRSAASRTDAVPV